MAYQFFDPNRPVDPMKVTLKPSRRVRVMVSREFATSIPNVQLDVDISIFPRKDNRNLQFPLITRSLKPKEESTVRADDLCVEEYLPEESYHLELQLRDAVSSRSVASAHREFVIPRGYGPLDLPPLSLEPPDSQKMVGKPAPEIDATDLDTGRPVKLADFRGKLVLVDFWGYWCGPCIESMSKLMELNRKFAGRPLVILAIHDQSVQSRAIYDRKIATARGRVWGGRGLPFPVLLDRPDPEKPEDGAPEGTGTSVRRYGIVGFPTQFLIDQHGIMIGRVSGSQRNRLDSVIEELLQKVEKDR